MTQGKEEQEQARKQMKVARRVVARRARLSVVAVIGRLLASGSLSARHFRWLGINIVANFVAFGPSIKELVRQLCRRCTQVEQADPALAGMMPVIFLGAMKVAYLAVANAGEDEEEASRLHDFSELCKKLASMYAGHNLKRDEIMGIMRKGTSIALQEAPSQLSFLTMGIKHFIPKIPAADAATLASELETTVGELRNQGQGSNADAGAGADDPEWSDYTSYLHTLKERASKTRVGAAKGVLKVPGGKGAGGGPGAKPGDVATKGRKISFAPATDEQPQSQDGRGASPPEGGPSPAGDGASAQKAAGAGSLQHTNSSLGAGGDLRASSASHSQGPPSAGPLSPLSTSQGAGGRGTGGLVYHQEELVETREGPPSAGYLSPLSTSRSAGGRGSGGLRYQQEEEDDLVETRESDDMEGAEQEDVGGDVGDSDGDGEKDGGQDGESDGDGEEDGGQGVEGDSHRGGGRGGGARPVQERGNQAGGVRQKRGIPTRTAQGSGAGADSQPSAAAPQAQGQGGSRKRGRAVVAPEPEESFPTLATDSQPSGVEPELEDAIPTLGVGY
eukprot:gene10580-12239_t